MTDYLYKDPLLYHCSMTSRISWCYQTLHSKLPFRTLFHLMIQKMDFSVTNRQLVLLYRLYGLFMQLLNGEIQRDAGQGDNTEQAEQEGEQQQTHEEGEDAISLGTWYITWQTKQVDAGVDFLVFLWGKYRPILRLLKNFIF